MNDLVSVSPIECRVTTHSRKRRPIVTLPLAPGNTELGIGFPQSHLPVRETVSPTSHAALFPLDSETPREATYMQDNLLVEHSTVPGGAIPDIEPCCCG